MEVLLAVWHHSSAQSVSCTTPGRLAKWLPIYESDQGATASILGDEYLGISVDVYAKWLADDIRRFG